jgi:hypothetical protein
MKPGFAVTIASFRIMRKVLLAASALLVFAVPAKADLILSNLVFRDLGGTGFGTAPRLLTLQNNPLESGGTIAGPGGTTQFFYGGVPTVPQTSCTNNGTCGVAGGGTLTGANQSLVYSVGALGWLTGAQVGIGLDTNQTGSSGPLTFNTLVLTLYNSSGTVLGSFSGNGPVDISEALLDFQQGNGNSVFDIRLDAAQQAQYDAILLANGGAFNVYEGLRASFGCGANGPAVCGTPGNFASNDGAESFLAFQAEGTVRVPEPSTWVLLITGFVFFGLMAYRKNARLRFV